MGTSIIQITVKPLPRMKISEISRALRQELLPVASSFGFSEVDAQCIYVRRTPEVVHVLAIDTSRHGPRFRAFIYGWIPEFLSSDEQHLDLSEQLLSHCCREEFLSVHSVGPAKWWPAGTFEQAAQSGRQLAAAFVRGALPWFAGIKTRVNLERLLMPGLPDWVAARLATGQRYPMPAQLAALPVWELGEPHGEPEDPR